VIIDTSAIVAILLREPEAPAIARAIAQAPVRRLSAATYVELAAMIDGRRDPVLSGVLDATLARSGIEIVPLSVQQARLARDAYQRFGKGSGHAAHLNLGDCFSYALARDLAEPLLFKGDDFALTDIEMLVEPNPHRRLSEKLATYGRDARA
jgi:ribonuclease VapC